LAKGAPHLIWLDFAFLRVLALFEAADGVPETLQLGSALAPRSPETVRPYIEAKGRNAQLALGAAPQPKRGGGFVESIPSGVPSIPTSHQLLAFLRDREEDEVQASPAEQRICRTHDWLMQRLSDGRIKTRAERWIVPLDQADAKRNLCPGPVSADWWPKAELNYHERSAQVAGEWEVRLDGHKVVGHCSMAEIALDEDDLRQHITDVPIYARLTRCDSESGPAWNISWSGTDFGVDCSKAVALHRAMLALQVLLRNPRHSVSCPLLAGLSRRSVGPKSSVPPAVAALRQLIDPICRKLAADEISAEEAERSLAAVLGNSTAPRDSVQQFLLKESNLVYDSLKKFKDYLRRNGTSAKLDLATFLDRSVRRSERGVRYLPKGERVDWVLSCEPRSSTGS
jgi:hypothetical protein